MMAREVTLPSIELVLEMMASDSLPSLDKIKEFIARPGQVCLDAHIPHSASDRRSVNFSDKNVEVSTDIGLTAGLSTEELDGVNNLDDEFIEDDTGPQYKKNYDTNNAIINRPMRHDLNSIVTVKGLANYYIGLTEKCLEDKDDNPWSNADAQEESGLLIGWKHLGLSYPMIAHLPLP